MSQKGRYALRVKVNWQICRCWWIPYSPVYCVVFHLISILLAPLTRAWWRMGTFLKCTFILLIVWCVLLWNNCRFLQQFFSVCGSFVTRSHHFASFCACFACSSCKRVTTRCDDDFGNGLNECREGGWTCVGSSRGWDLVYSSIQDVIEE